MALGESSSNGYIKSVSKHPRRRAKSAKGTYGWAIYRIAGARGDKIGHVEAADAAEAIANAVKEFDVPEAEIDRLIARRTG
jgi:hypothetical protein